MMGSKPTKRLGAGQAQSGYPTPMWRPPDLIIDTVERVTGGKPFDRLGWACRHRAEGIAEAVACALSADFDDFLRELV